MISEFPNIPRQLTPEDRFIISVKNELRKHAQEINKLSKSIKGIDLSDYYTKGEMDTVIQELQEAIDRIPDNVVTEEELQEALSNVQVDLPSWIEKLEVNDDNKLCQVVRA